MKEEMPQEAVQEEILIPGRVISQYKDFYKVSTGAGEMLAKISGRLRYDASDLRDYPAVGDHVLLDREDPLGGDSSLHRFLGGREIHPDQLSSCRGGDSDGGNQKG